MTILNRLFTQIGKTDKMERVLGGFVLLLFGFYAIALPPFVGAEPISENEVTRNLTAFTIGNNNTYTNIGGQPTATGSFGNGNTGAYPEGSCIPVLITATNRSATAGDILVTPYYDHTHSNGTVIGVDTLEHITVPDATSPGSTSNLNQIVFSGSQLSSTTFLTTAGTPISASISGPYKNSTGTDAISAGDLTRHFNINLAEVPSGETVNVIFCARLGLDAAEWQGSSASLRLAQGGNQNIPLASNNTLYLPSLTIEKTFATATGTSSDWSFNVSPAINGQSVFNIEEGATSTTIENVPDGVYTITETGPDGYVFNSGTGESCVFTNDTATATVASGDNVGGDSATCTFVNAALERPTLNVDVTIDGGTASEADFGIALNGTVIDVANLGTAVTYDPGAYTVTFSEVENYTVSFGQDCVDTRVLDLDYLENLTCEIIFTYSEPAPETGTITLIKEVVGIDIDPSIFLLTLNGEVVPQNTPLVRNVGEHTVSEFFLPFFTASFSEECADGIIQLDAGEHVTCTITNTYAPFPDPNPEPTTGTITVIKKVINDNGGIMTVENFQLFIGETQVTSGVANVLTPGNYVVSEVEQEFYTGSFSGDCDANGNITLAAGQNLTCTITNNDNPPTWGTITVIKEVINDNGGTATAADFPLFVDGFTMTSGVAGEFGVGAHVVSEISNANYAATFSGDCDANGNIILGGGQNLTCTITNNDIAQPEPEPEPTTGTITVIKEVINDDFGDDGSDMTINDFRLYVEDSAGNEVGTGFGTLVVENLPFGTYTVDEVNQEFYTKTFSANCAEGTVTLSADNAHITCTITNNDIAVFNEEEPIDTTGTLTVVKVVINDDSGTLQISDFPLFVNGDQITSGVTIELEAGQYVVTETTQGGYEGTFSGACDANGNVTVIAGQDVVCTITNDDTEQVTPPAPQEPVVIPGPIIPVTPIVPTPPSPPTPAPTPTLPPGEVLGEQDDQTSSDDEEDEEVDVVTPPPQAPTPIVLGDQDELPRTGLPPGALYALAAAAFIGIVRKQK